MRVSIAQSTTRGSSIWLRTFSLRAIWDHGGQETITVKGLLLTFLPGHRPSHKPAERHPPCRLQHRATHGEGCPLSSPTQAARGPGCLRRPGVPSPAGSPTPLARETGQSYPLPAQFGSLATVGTPPHSKSLQQTPGSALCPAPSPASRARAKFRPSLRTDGFLHLQLCLRGTFCG